MPAPAFLRPPYGIQRVDEAVVAFWTMDDPIFHAGPIECHACGRFWPLPAAPGSAFACVACGTSLACDACGSAPYEVMQVEMPTAWAVDRILQGLPPAPQRQNLCEKCFPGIIEGHYWTYMHRVRTRWRPFEDSVLRAGRAAGRTAREIAGALYRTPNAVRKRAAALGLVTRPARPDSEKAR